MLSIRNWGQFQHYKRRRPPWIKLYRQLLDNPEWFALDDASARLLPELWLIGSEMGGVLPAIDVLAFRLRRSEAKILQCLKSLVDKHFVDDASNVLAECLQDAIPEERRGEVDVPISSLTPLQIPTPVEHHSENGNGNGSAGPSAPARDDPAPWMHELWHSELGNGKRVRMTDSRRQKYRAMYQEQLSESPDPHTAWRVVLRAVRQSPYHMENRAYQLPESLLKNADRRDKWVQETISLIEKADKKSTAASDFAAYYRSRSNGHD